MEFGQIPHPEFSAPSGQLKRDAQQLISSLSLTAALRRVPAHCGLSRNEEADELTKRGISKEQLKQAIPDIAAKAVVTLVVK